MYDNKQQGYFGGVRKELLNLIPSENRQGKMLELGAGSGNNLLYAKQNGFANNVYGVELVKIEDSNQTNEEFEKFEIGNIENMEFSYEEEFFDVIMMGDVLEHLVDPYEMVRKLKKYLKPNGVFIASIPNVRNLKTFRNIYFRGSFNYTDEGIFDRTHLRFFTKKDMKALFEDNGYKMMEMQSNLKFKKGSVAFKNRITRGIFEEFWTAIYFMMAKKA